MEQELWLSASGANLFDTCPNKYKQNRITKVALDIDFSISAILGTTTHNLVQKQMLKDYMKNGCIDSINAEQFEAEFMTVIPAYFYKKYDSKIFNSITPQQIEEIERKYDNERENDKIEPSLRELYIEWRNNIMETSAFKLDIKKMFECWANTTNCMIENLGSILMENEITFVTTEDKRYTKVDEKIGLVYVTDIRGYDDDGNVTVIELKTSSKTVKDIPPTNMEQVLLYKRCLREEHIGKELKYFSIYGSCLKTKQGAITVDLCDFEQEGYEELLKSKIEMIKFCYQNDVFPTRFSQACSYCNVSNCIGCIRGKEED